MEECCSDGVLGNPAQQGLAKRGRRVEDDGPRIGNTSPPLMEGQHLIRPHRLVCPLQQTDRQADRRGASLVLVRTWATQHSHAYTWTERAARGSRLHNDKVIDWVSAGLMAATRRSQNKHCLYRLSRGCLTCQSAKPADGQALIRLGPDITPRALSRNGGY